MTKGLIAVIMQKKIVLVVFLLIRLMLRHIMVCLITVKLTFGGCGRLISLIVTPQLSIMRVTSVGMAAR